MPTPFSIEQGIYGKKMIVNHSLNEEIILYMNKNKIFEIELNYAKGWIGNNLYMVSNIFNLKSLIILDWNYKDLKNIAVKIPSLLDLSISTRCNSKINFANYPNLEKCNIYWRPKAKSIFDCITLKELNISHYKGKNTYEISLLKNLEYLSIITSPLNTITDLKHLDKLKYLGLFNLSKLSSLAGLETLIQIEKLEIENCKQINNIDELINLRNLNTLKINNTEEISSLKPIAKLTKLNSLEFGGSTTILDGDLTPITKFKLDNIVFGNRPHYSHTQKELYKN